MNSEATVWPERLKKKTCKSGVERYTCLGFSFILLSKFENTLTTLDQNIQTLKSKGFAWGNVICNNNQLFPRLRIYFLSAMQLSFSRELVGISSSSMIRGEESCRELKES